MPWTWENKYSVGVDIVDSQHMKLFDLINKVERLSKESKQINVDSVAKVLEELLEYTKSHFHEEEMLMERHAYFDLERHKKLHKLFVDKIVLFNDNFPKGPKQVLEIMLPFLVNWLQQHILIEDKKYSKNVSKKFRL